MAFKSGANSYACVVFSFFFFFFSGGGESAMWNVEHSNRKQTNFGCCRMGPAGDVHTLGLRLKDRVAHSSSG